jgi:4-amino-4-deoxychorismate lyase
LYQADIEHIEFNIYVPKKIERLKLVATEMDYQYKWEDRTQINELVNTQPLYDDVLLTKNGLITDTSYANIIFKKDNEFYTPKSPLLKGTKRQQLLDEEILIEKNIRANEVYKFSHFALINALNDLDLTQFIPTKNIFK